MSTQETPLSLEMTIYAENMESGHRDVPIKRVVEKFPSGYSLWQFFHKHCKIIREGDQLTRRLKYLAKQRGKNVAKELGSELVHQLIADAGRS